MYTFASMAEKKYIMQRIDVPTKWLINHMAAYEDRKQTAIIRRAIELYAAQEHPDLLAAYEAEKQKKVHEKTT